MVSTVIYLQFAPHDQDHDNTSPPRRYFANTWPIVSLHKCGLSGTEGNTLQVTLRAAGRCPYQS